MPKFWLHICAISCSWHLWKDFFLKNRPDRLLSSIKDDWSDIAHQTAYWNTDHRERCLYCSPGKKTHTNKVHCLNLKGAHIPLIPVQSPGLWPVFCSGHFVQFKTTKKGFTCSQKFPVILIKCVQPPGTFWWRCSETYLRLGCIM